MIYRDIQRLINYAIENGLIESEDIYVIRNQLMEVFQLTDWQETESECRDFDIDEILSPLVDYACKHKIIPNTTASRDLFDTKLMGILTPMPREVIADFRRYYSQSPISATDWYYKFSQDVNYVRKGRIAKDLKWTYESDYGTLDITINRSKPEKTQRILLLQKRKRQLRIQNASFVRKMQDLQAT